MERLTIRNSDGSVSQPTGLKWAEALERLTAYEDTGLTPEDIQEVVDLFKKEEADSVLEAPKEVKSWMERCVWHVRKADELARALGSISGNRLAATFGISTEREYQLIQAAKEGRIIELPCREKDILYCFWEIPAKPGYIVYPAEVKEVSYGHFVYGPYERRIRIIVESLEFRGRRATFYGEDFGRSIFKDAESAVATLKKIAEVTRK